MTWTGTTVASAGSAARAGAAAIDRTAAAAVPITIVLPVHMRRPSSRAGGARGGRDAARTLRRLGPLIKRARPDYRRKILICRYRLWR
ncbi:hypothetical protein ABGB11_03860 [Actinomadura sp. B10D3]